MRIKFFAENSMDQIQPAQHGVYGIRAVPQAGREAENVIGADSGAPGQFRRQPLSGCGRGAYPEYSVPPRGRTLSVTVNLCNREHQSGQSVLCPDINCHVKNQVTRN